MKRRLNYFSEKKTTKDTFFRTSRFHPLRVLESYFCGKHNEISFFPDVDLTFSLTQYSTTSNVQMYTHAHFPCAPLGCTVREWLFHLCMPLMCTGKWGYVRMFIQPRIQFDQFFLRRFMKSVRGKKLDDTQICWMILREGGCPQYLLSISRSVWKKWQNRIWYHQGQPDPPDNPGSVTALLESNVRNDDMYNMTSHDTDRPLPPT